MEIEEMVTAVDTMFTAHQMPAENHYAVAVGTDGEVVVVAIDANDPYDLLDNDQIVSALKEYGNIGLVTHGWAAPLNDDGEPDGMPSEHPLRRRVRLVAHTTLHYKMTSLVRFIGEDEEPIISDEGEGTLKDAIWGLLAKATL